MKKINALEIPVLEGFFNCPKCKHKIPDIVVVCNHCGLELNSNKKIRHLVKTLQETEIACKRLNRRLKEMNLLFSKVIKWNYNKRFYFRNMEFKEINRLIHKWQRRKGIMMERGILI